MAQYAPPAYALSDEQEYLQAYEDVLEKYKGRRVSVEWICVTFRTKKKLPDCCLTVQQMSACSPPFSLSGDWLVLVSLSLLWKKWEYFLHDITFRLNLNSPNKGFLSS